MDLPLVEKYKFAAKEKNKDRKMGKKEMKPRIIGLPLVEQS